MPDLTPWHWLLAAFAAIGVGVAKSGFVGLSLLHVVVFAFLFGARDSTGIILPLLLVGDVAAVAAFRQHARWDYVRLMLPPTCLGIVVGVLVMGRLDDAAFRPVIGWIILSLVALQLARMRWPERLGDIPHSPWFAWALGLLTGLTTMLANAAGPVWALYALAVGLPKFEFVGTTAWLFLILNAFKVPFSAALGLIHVDGLLLNVALAPFVVAGLLGGRWLTPRISQRLFDALLLTFAAAAAVRLITS